MPSIKAAMLTLALLAVTVPAEAATVGDGPLFERAGVAPSTQVREAPDFQLPDLAGHPVSLSDLSGNLVVLNFWATWCGPCIEEMPALERMAKRFAGRGLRVLAVSLDVGAPEEVAEFARGYGWNLPILLDPLSTVGDLYAVRVMPTTYLIGPDGTILGRSFGAREWDGADALALLETLLTRSKPHID